MMSQVTIESNVLYRLIKFSFIIYLFTTFTISNIHATRFVCSCTRNRKCMRAAIAKNEMLPSTVEALGRNSSLQPSPTVVQVPDNICNSPACIHTGK